MSLYKRPGSQFYWCKFKIGGRAFYKPTGKTNHREAEIEERRLRAEIEAAPRVSLATHILGECFELDLERAQTKGTKAVSQGDLRYHWKALLRHLGMELPLTDVNYALMEGYVLKRRAEGSRGQTIRRELYALRRGLRLAFTKGWIKEIPPILPPVKRDPKDKRRAGKLHPPEVLTAFLNQLTPDARDEYTFILYTGLRWQELKRARVSWVVKAPEGAAVPAFLELPETGTKTSQARTIALPQAAYEIVARRMGVAPDGQQFLFSQQQHWVGVRAATKRIGYDKNITMRDMRKIWATMTSRLSKDRDAVKSTLGHTNMNTTDIYVAEADRASLAAAANTTAAWVGGTVTGGQVVFDALTMSEKPNIPTGLVVSAVGIEPTTYGLRVQPQGDSQTLDMSISAQLAALHDMLKQLETPREGDRLGGQAQNADVPWADDFDVELVG